MNKCKLCGYVFSEDNLEDSIETHLLEKHFLDYQAYYEILVLGTPYIECWKCGSHRYTLSPYLQSIHLPCSCCIDAENKQTIQDIKTDLQGKIKDFQAILGKSKYYQYLLSMSNKERERLLPKDFSIQAENLLSLKRRDGVRLDKSTIFRVTNQLGRSPEISTRNLDSLYLETTDLKVEEECSGVYRIGDTDICISLPEVIPFDQKHHSRGSILNPNVKRLARKLKLTGGECIKFWNPPNLSARTILHLSDKNGKSLSWGDLGEDLQWKVKFGILKTKPILTRIFDIYNEIFKYVSWIEDSVFLLNSIDIPFPQSDLGLSLVWSWEEYDHNLKSIKLSIL